MVKTIYYGTVESMRKLDSNLQLELSVHKDNVIFGLTDQKKETYNPIVLDIQTAVKLHRELKRLIALAKEESND